MTKSSWFVAAVVLAIACAALRLITLNGPSPAWAAALLPLTMVATMVCLFLSGQMRFTPRDVRAMYERKARNSLFTGLVCLILIPVLLWLAYARYYGPLAAALSSGEWLAPQNKNAPQ